MKNAKNILLPDPSPLSVAVLVLDECNTLSFAAAVDPMRAANRVARRRLFDWIYVTADGRDAKLTSGLTVPGNPVAGLETCDLLIVVAGFNLENHSRPQLLASLRRLASGGTTLAGIDGGPWLIASAGLLDGYRATTHWEDLDRFARHFPEVTTLRDRFHVDRTRMTSGGAMPAIDMMLYLIGQRFGSKLSSQVAGLFIYDSAPDPARAQRRLTVPIRHSSLTARASAEMEDAIDTPLTIAQLSRRVGCSQRTLQTQFRAHLGTTPQAHYLSLRLAEALRLVRDTSLVLTDIALATGFASPSAFSRAFRTEHGVSARELRRIPASETAGFTK